MSKLVSMKLDPKSREERAEPSSLATDQPAYPWGLSVTLDSEALEKLGLDVTDLEVGSTMSLIAKVEVTSISSNQSKGNDDNQSASLQITDLCLEDGEDAADAADKLYEKAQG